MFATVRWTIDEHTADSVIDAAADILQLVLQLIVRFTTAAKCAAGILQDCASLACTTISTFACSSGQTA